MLKIQISNPGILKLKNNDDLSLEEAVETIFPLDTEYLLMIWNNIFIPLSYKYDISLMILDFIKVIQFINSPVSNKIEIHWPSNTFSSIWYLEKVNGDIMISSVWNQVIGATEELLNKSNKNTVGQKQLEHELKKVLRFIKVALEKSGLNKNSISDYKLLEENC